MTAKRAALDTAEERVLSLPLLIVNPRSGGGRTGRVFEAMRPAIEQALGKIDVIYTERPAHGIELAKAGALEHRPLVVAVGGDGTFHEVVNGVLRAQSELAGSALPDVGIIGQGTGGDFVRTLGIEHRLDRYLAILRLPKTRPLDVGRIRFVGEGGTPRDHYFVNIVSAGMSGLVDQIVAGASRALGGTVAYFTASLRALLQSEIGNLRCTFSRSGETEERRFSARLVAVCNGRYFGSGMNIAPMASIADGVFEVVALEGRSKIGMALGSSRLYRGSHIGDPDVIHFSCEKITLSLENEQVADRFLLDVDGEPLGRLPLEVTGLPAALRLRAPPELRRKRETGD